MRLATYIASFKNKYLSDFIQKKKKKIIHAGKYIFKFLQIQLNSLAFNFS
jgi:hypothetical protein